MSISERSMARGPLACAGAVPEVLSYVHTVAGQEAAGWLQNTNDSRRATARTPWLGPDLAARFARSRSETLRANVAANPVTPAPLLEKLANDLKFSVRHAARRNPSTPYTRPERGAATTDGEDRERLEAALQHPECDVDLLLACLDDRDRGEAALQHPRLPVDAIERVLGEIAAAGPVPPTDSGSAASGVDGGREAAKRAVRAMRRRALTLLTNPALTQPQADVVLAYLQRIHYGPAVWQWADHPNASEQWLAQTLDHVVAEATASGAPFPSQGMLSRLASHPNASRELLERALNLGVHPGCVLGNPGCPPELMTAFLDEADEIEPLPGRGATRLLHGSVLHHYVIGANPAATLDVLDRVTASELAQYQRYEFVARRARSRAEAELMLELLPAWMGTLGELLRVCAAATAPTEAPGAGEAQEAGEIAAART